MKVLLVAIGMFFLGTLGLVLEAQTMTNWLLYIILIVLLAMESKRGS